MIGAGYMGHIFKMASPKTINPDRQDNLETTNMNESRQQRHSKRLSLNFPVLIPSVTTTTDQSNRQISSPSPHPSRSPMHMHNMSAPATSILPMPLTPPSESSEDGSLECANPQYNSPTSRQHKKCRHGRSRSTVPSRIHTNPTTPPDFLTLLASQERRVLELKEELARAEAELMELKKSWALHEAGRKKTEFRGGVVKMSPISSPGSKNSLQHNHAKSTNGTVGLGVELNDNIDVEGKRRELAKEKLMRRGHSEESNGSPGNKKTNQRVFSGSRHTRALSLLSTSTLNSMNNQNGAMFHSAMPNSVNIMPNNSKPLLNLAKTVSSTDKDTTDSTTTLTSIAPLLRTNSGLSKDPLNFGKTYKELASAAAASRRQIPQGLAPDQIVKQGKIVVDGVRDGLWNFFEDIRQATVGEEATSETGAVQQPSIKRSKSQSSQKNKTQESGSFWREFGIDTPKGDKIIQIKSEKDGTNTNTNANVCPKHSHSHDHHKQNPRRGKSNQVKDKTSPLQLPQTSTTSISTSPADPDQPSHQQPKEGKLIEYEHESKSSTDFSSSSTTSSTTSTNPPSLVIDDSNSNSSPPQDVDDIINNDDENDNDDDWEWGGFESPESSKFRGVGDVGSEVKERKDTGSGIKEVRWYELMS